MAFAHDTYELKLTPDSSHGRLLDWMSRLPPARVLDLGCADGRFGALLRAQGHTVTGVDVTEHDGVGDRLDRFVTADLDGGIPDEVGDAFDVVLAADVLEHTAQPAELLRRTTDLLAPGGVVLVSVPNFAHWYPRARVALGRFDYDRRGILDAGHVRFFTRRSIERLMRESGFTITRHEVVGLPLEVMERGSEAAIETGSTAAGGGGSAVGRVVAAIDRTGVRLWPTMFGYQFLYEVRPDHTG